MSVKTVVMVALLSVAGAAPATAEASPLLDPVGLYEEVQDLRDGLSATLYRHSRDTRELLRRILG